MSLVNAGKSQDAESSQRRRQLRNFTQYNFQVLRDDIFMLGRDGTVTGNRVAPVRSSSAVLVSSQNQNREWIYSQQQTTSAEGFAGQAFNTHIPHTVRGNRDEDVQRLPRVGKERQQCVARTDCSCKGTNFVNFMGRYVYVAADDSLRSCRGNRAHRTAGCVWKHATEDCISARITRSSNWAEAS